MVMLLSRKLSRFHQKMHGHGKSPPGVYGELFVTKDPKSPRQKIHHTDNNNNNNVDDDHDNYQQPQPSKSATSSPFCHRPI
mmetsp:Transcript_57244/g.139574  ORF Transcript_57244/g.139574 Transcript_57244/m.139574 type:complete len:81 (-) Transcript_57244:140-382(-)